MTKLKYLISTLVLLALLSGCTITYRKAIINDYVNDGIFDTFYINQEKIAIGGLVGQYSNISDTERSTMNSQLFDYVSSRLGSENIVPNNIHIDLKHIKLGNLSTDSDSRENGLKLQTNLKEFSDLARYVIFYEIQSDRIRQSDYRNNDERCYVTDREMTIRLHIYDTKTLQNSWGGSVSQNYDRERCKVMYTSKNTSGKNAAGKFVAGLVVTALDNAAFGTHPNAVNTKYFSRRIFRGFMSNIPKNGEQVITKPSM